MTNAEEEQEGATKQSNINQHCKRDFEDMIYQGLTSGGIQATASKGHGKSRLLFKIAEELMKNPEVRLIAFDGSLAWLYGFSQIPVFQIREHDILSNERKSTEDSEKYSFENWHLVKLALEKHKDILFNLSTRKPSKRSFAIRTIINYLDNQQRIEKQHTVNHENTKAIAYILEEAQDAFNSRSTAKNECEEFLTVFNEARNNRESFFSCSQRLTDMSKTVRAKQIQVLGRLSSEDITPNLRRLEKQYKISFAEMPFKHWFFNGEVFESPEFKQHLKPYKINAEIKKEWLISLPKPKPLSLTEKIGLWLNPFSVPKRFKKPNSLFESENSETEIEEPETELNKIEKESENLEALESEKEDNELDEDFLSEDSEFMENW